jgi:hypothetical protein
MEARTRSGRSILRFGAGRRKPIRRQQRSRQVRLEYGDLIEIGSNLLAFARSDTIILGIADAIEGILARFTGGPTVVFPSGL